MKNINEILKYDTYDGTLESTTLLIKRLCAEGGNYKFDVITNEIILFNSVIKYRPGDCYTYRLHEKFECI